MIIKEEVEYMNLNITLQIYQTQNILRIIISGADAKHLLHRAENALEERFAVFHHVADNMSEYHSDVVVADIDVVAAYRFSVFESLALALVVFGDARPFFVFGAVLAFLLRMDIG